MTLSDRTISVLGKLFTGDPVQADGERIAPYRSGPDLVAFFQKYGFADEYGQGFPSRWHFVEQKLRALNGTATLARAVEAALHPAEYLDRGIDPGRAVAFLNRYLVLDAIELVAVAGRYRFRESARPGVDIDAALLTSEDPLTETFVNEQVEKCRRKLGDGDFDGAITNARTLVEAVLCEVERRLVSTPVPYDGDLMRLYKRVQKLLNLAPEREDVSDALRQVLRGLASVVGGLAPMRNKMGDAHPAVHRPHRRHAALAVNAAMTFSAFVLESFDFQVAAGRLRQPAS